MYELFKKFLKDKISELRKIVWRTKGEMLLEDVNNEAWAIGGEIGKKRGYEVDFENPADQDLIISALHVQLVKRREKNIQYSARIDEERSDDDGSSYTLADRLRASETSDPLTFLIQEEAVAEDERLTDEKLCSSYSEAAAYAIALRKFTNREQACRYLAVTNEALLCKLRRALRTLRLQPSLFDRIERISKSFMPLRGKHYVVKPEEKTAHGQMSWNF